MLNLTVLLVVGTFLLNGGEAAITWTTPSGGAGTCGSIVETATAAALSLTLVAVTDGQQAASAGAATIQSYTLGIPDRPHAGVTLTAAASGIVSLGSGFLRFEDQNTVTFTATAVDNAATAATSTATCTVTLTDANSSPVFAAPATVTTASFVAAGTSVATYTATEPDSDTITYSIASGDPLGTFVVAGSGVVSVSATRYLDSAIETKYTLIIRATDDGTPVETATNTLTICVGACPAGAGAVTIGLLTLFLALMASFD